MVSPGEIETLPTEMCDDADMATLWTRIPNWVDWLIALLAAIIVVNLNVTKAGDPLSSAGAEGISDLARTVFYSALLLGGLIVCALGVTISAFGSERSPTGDLLARTFAWVALAGTAGLLLDYRDGPVATVQLGAYVAVALSVVRLARIIGSDNREAREAAE